jgi:AbrB family looped-hinge helix DNA binding protein
VQDKSATFTSKGQLVIPVDLRRKHGITAGTKVKLLEDQFGRIVLQPITESYIDRVMGCLAEGPDLIKVWKEDRRREGRHEERKRKP